MSTTPRGSWASAIFDLKSTESDDLLKHVLDRSVGAEDQDKRNQGERAEERHQSIYSLYPMQLVRKTVLVSELRATVTFKVTVSQL